MTIICKYLGGSHSYGLNTPNSDFDWRGIFLNDKISQIVGLDRHDHQQKQDETEDVHLTELRRAMVLLRNGNTQIIEMLFNDKWEEWSPIWMDIQSKRARLVDSEKLFSCLRGYMQGEAKLTLGERKGKLGGKRYESVEKFGYSVKNFIQLVRLAWAGQVYFREGIFPVNVRAHDAELADWLLYTKTHPESLFVQEVKRLIALHEENLIEGYENRKINTVFDEELANDICFKAYFPILISHGRKQVADTLERIEKEWKCDIDPIY